MAAELIDRGDETYALVFNNDDVINVTLTSSGAEVDYWLAQILRIHRRRLHHLVVGLDAEWRPTRFQGERNPVALLQICVGRRCLLFQIAFADYVPRSLHRFLAEERFAFVGVGVFHDAEKLLEDYDLYVDRTVELGALAADEMEVESLRRAGLATLATAVLGVQLQKSSAVTMSRWDAEYLTLEQIKYAAVDAFVSFEIGRRLYAGEFWGSGNPATGEGFCRVIDGDGDGDSFSL